MARVLMKRWTGDKVVRIGFCMAFVSPASEGVQRCFANSDMMGVLHRMTRHDTLISADFGDLLTASVWMRGNLWSLYLYLDTTPR